MNLAHSKELWFQSHHQQRAETAVRQLDSGCPRCRVFRWHTCIHPDTIDIRYYRELYRQISIEYTSSYRWQD